MVPGRFIPDRVTGGTRLRNTRQSDFWFLVSGFPLPVASPGEGLQNQLMAALARNKVSSGRAWFLLSSLTVLAICCAIVRSHAYSERPDVMAWSVTFDLTLTIPFLFYLFVGRRSRSSAFLVVPLFVACLAIASAVVPRDQHFFLRTLEFLAAPAELFVIGFLIVRVRRALRASNAPPSSDGLDRARAAAISIVGNRMAAEVLVGEVAVWYFAVAGWRRSNAPDDPRAITFHRQSGWGAVLSALVIVLAGESLAVHVVVQHFSAIAAWIITLSEAYGVLWLLGDYNALRSRPTVVGGGQLEIRYGLRWNATVDFSNIAAIEHLDPLHSDEARRRRSLRVAILQPATRRIVLREPLTAYAMYGIHRTVDSIELAPDDLERFDRLVGRKGEE
jgi:hypothetical protein